MTQRTVLWNKETGQRLERWPVDAREMISTGAYTDVQPPNAESATTSPVTTGSDQVVTKNGETMPNGVVVAIGNSPNMVESLSVRSAPAKRR